METRHAADISSAHIRPGSSNDPAPQHARDRATGAPATPGTKPGDDARAGNPAGHPSPMTGPAAPRSPDLPRRATPIIRPRPAGAAPVTPAAPAPISLRNGADRVAARLRTSIGADRFDGSFSNKAIFRIDDGILEVAAPNKVLSGLIERRFGDVIRHAAQTELGECPVRFVVAADLFGPQSLPAASPDSEIEPKPQARTAQPLARKTAPRPPATLDRYRIDNFIVGESNRLAFNAAVALAENDPAAATYSPLFIHGPCGVGKTHLLGAIAQRFKERHPGAAVRVTGGEAFMNEYVTGVRAGDVERFRRAFRRVDLLCIDDVHFLSNKQSTQGELLHTLDELERGGARIVMASDEHPRQIKQFSAALISRFMAGMVAGIQPPDAALREKCVRMFARQRGLNLDQPAVDLLVQRTGQLPGQDPTTIRDIEGLITRIDALHRLVPDYGAESQSSQAQPIGVLLVERALGHSGGSTVVDPSAPIRAPRPVRIDAIITHTCAALAVDQADLSGKTRHPRVVLSRAIITHLARQMTTLSYPEIARAIGRPNHSTVITAFQRFAKQLAADEAVDAPGAPEARTLPILVRQLSVAVQNQPSRK